MFCNLFFYPFFALKKEKSICTVWMLCEQCPLCVCVCVCIYMYIYVYIEYCFLFFFLSSRTFTRDEFHPNHLPNLSTDIPYEDDTLPHPHEMEMT